MIWIRYLEFCHAWPADSVEGGDLHLSRGALRGRGRRGHEGEDQEVVHDAVDGRTGLDGDGGTRGGLLYGFNGVGVGGIGRPPRRERGNNATKYVLCTE